MDTFNIVMATVSCVFALFCLVFLIVMKYYDFKAEEEEEKEELDDSLSRLRRDVSDNYHYFRNLEKEFVCLRCKFDSFEKKLKSLNKGKSKK